MDNNQAVIIRFQKDDDLLNPRYHIIIGADHLGDFQEMIAAWYKHKGISIEFEFIN